jgi:phosphoribosylglycinamide formyltransferase-1
MQADEVRLAIFASGNGSNAQRIAEYFTMHPTIRVCLILTNNADAFVRTRASLLGIPCIVFNRQELHDQVTLPKIFHEHGIQAIVLAGFLWLIPAYLLGLFQNRILNIHPALLPRYGGKGMYGNKVHEAVINAGETDSGITIHRVNERYDEGDILFQARCPVYLTDTPATLAMRIHELEYKHFPEVIEREVLTMFRKR